MNDKELDRIDVNMDLMMQEVEKRGKKGIIAYFIQQENGEYGIQLMGTKQVKTLDCLTALAAWTDIMATDSGADMKKTGPRWQK